MLVKESLISLGSGIKERSIFYINTLEHNQVSKLLLNVFNHNSQYTVQHHCSSNESYWSIKLIL